MLQRAPASSVVALVGRDREWALVADLLRGVRAVTVTGTGGCCKTRLAIEVAGDVEARFVDGVAWANLGSVRGPGMVAAAAASALGAYEKPGRDLLDTLVADLRDREVLLVLDCCEHVVEGCAALVARLLHACPGVRVLATSREPLAVAGETTFGLPPLPVPDADARTAEAVATADAVRLFVRRAQQARPDFRLTDGPI